jgi:hypothetical protein
MSELLRRTVILTGYLEDGSECPRCEGFPLREGFCSNCAGKGFIENENSFQRRVDRFQNKNLPEHLKPYLKGPFDCAANGCIQYFFLTSGSSRGWDINIEHEWYCQLLLEEFPVEAVLVTQGETDLRADMRHTVTSTPRRPT